MNADSRDQIIALPAVDAVPARWSARAIGGGATPIPPKKLVQRTHRWR